MNIPLLLLLLMHENISIQCLLLNLVYGFIALNLLILEEDIYSLFSLNVGRDLRVGSTGVLGNVIKCPSMGNRKSS